MSTPAGDVLWAPSAARVDGCEMTRFRDRLAAAGFEVGTDYAELWQWSVDHLDAFWEQILLANDVAHSAPYERVRAGTMPDTEWFPGIRLNYAEHLLAQGEDAAVAVIHAGEDRPREELTWGELRTAVAEVAGCLRELEVGVGDRVVSCLPNTVEALIASLATASIGAIWSSCSPDFGVGTIVDRFAQVEPTVLFCTDGYSYGGRWFDRSAEIEELRRALPTLTTTVHVRSSKGGEIAGALEWDAARSCGAGGELRFAQLPFDAPLWILYSSGTTGLPKAIIHSHGGILLEHLKVLRLHLDLGPGDRFFWYTTTGWMMWNFLISGLLTGATIVLYDGSPGYPDLGALWSLMDETGVTCMGVGAPFIAQCMKSGVRPREGRELSALRSIGSTASPLSPEGFDWVYEQLGPEIWLFSMTGGTDVCTAFVGGVPTLPVYRGELQGRALGCAVASWDADGRPLIGEVGELVITAPMPSMPAGFWGDSDGTRYRESYFDVYPGVWRHGDWIEITERGTAIIFGRSDSTINRGGIRIGTSEIYRAVLADDAVLDALVVDVPRPGTQGVISLFVQVREGTALDDELRDRIRATIRAVCTPRHVPDEIVAIDEVPRTLTGKILEVPVKRILMGADPDVVVSRDALANPRALDPFIARAAGSASS